MDELFDLAVVRITPARAKSPSFPIANLGNSDNLQAGDWVIAVGRWAHSRFPTLSHIFRRCPAYFDASPADLRSPLSILTDGLPAANLPSPNPRWATRSGSRTP